MTHKQWHKWGLYQKHIQIDWDYNLGWWKLYWCTFDILLITRASYEWQRIGRLSRAGRIEWDLPLLWYLMWQLRLRILLNSALHTGHFLITSSSVLRSLCATDTWCVAFIWLVNCAASSNSWAQALQLYILWTGAVRWWCPTAVMSVKRSRNINTEYIKKTKLLIKNTFLFLSEFASGSDNQ